MTKRKKTKTALHEAARRRIGVPFLHKGRNPDKALDCVGLGVVAARELGWDVQDLAEYSKHPKDGKLEQMLAANCGAPVVVGVPRLDQLKPDDLVAMHFDDASTKRRRKPRHPVRHVGIVGIYEGRLTLIHTDSHIGRVVEQSIDETILARIAAVYRRAV